MFNSADQLREFGVPVTAPCLTVADDLGFQTDEAEVVYCGTCPDCLGTGKPHEELSQESDTK